MYREPYLLSAMPPTAGQRRVATVVAALLAVGFGCALPFASVQLVAIQPFIPIVDTVLFLSDVIVAALLYAQFSIVRSRALLVLASGYLVSALLIAAHLLTFPGAFSARGLLGGNLQSTIWIYIFWHAVLPVAAISYAFLKTPRKGTRDARVLVRAAIVTSIVLATAAAALLTWMAVDARGPLPVLMKDSVEARAAWSAYIAPVLITLSAISIVMVWRRRTSVLDLWLLVVLFAWFIETVLLGLTSSRYSLVWYAGRIYGVISSGFVMLMLLAETSILYARLASSVVARGRESEAKRMTMEVAMDAIAHELNQPLCSIVANSDAAVSLLNADQPDLDEAKAALDQIASEGQRASEIVRSTRAALVGEAGSSAYVQLEVLLREALLLLRVEMRAHQINVSVEHAPAIPAIRGDRDQLLQLFINLFMNALEAMSAKAEGERRLRIRSTVPSPKTVAVWVEDSGEGIAPEHVKRIFDPFYTTKPNGTGLGLALCRMIAETHGGEISVQAGEGGGTAFRVVLSVGTVEAEATDPLTRPPTEESA